MPSILYFIRENNTKEKNQKSSNNIETRDYKVHIQMQWFIQSASLEKLKIIFLLTSLLDFFSISYYPTLNNLTSKS